MESNNLVQKIATLKRQANSRYASQLRGSPRLSSQDPQSTTKPNDLQTFKGRNASNPQTDRNLDAPQNANKFLKLQSSPNNYRQHEQQPQLSNQNQNHNRVIPVKTQSKPTKKVEKIDHQAEMMNNSSDSNFSKRKMSDNPYIASQQVDLSQISKTNLAQLKQKQNQQNFEEKKQNCSPVQKQFQKLPKLDRSNSKTDQSNTNNNNGSQSRAEYLSQMIQETKKPQIEMMKQQKLIRPRKHTVLSSVSTQPQVFQQEQQKSQRGISQNSSKMSNDFTPVQGNSHFSGSKTDRVYQQEDDSNYTSPYTKMLQNQAQQPSIFDNQSQLPQVLRSSQSQSKREMIDEQVTDDEVTTPKIYRIKKEDLSKQQKINLPDSEYKVQKNTQLQPLQSKYTQKLNQKLMQSQRQMELPNVQKPSKVLMSNQNGSPIFGGLNNNDECMFAGSTGGFESDGDSNVNNFNQFSQQKQVYKQALKAKKLSQQHQSESSELCANCSGQINIRHNHKHQQNRSVQRATGVKMMSSITINNQKQLSQNKSSIVSHTGALTLDDLLNEQLDLQKNQQIEELHYVSVKVERLKKKLISAIEKKKSNNQSQEGDSLTD